jgi:hypothetical protein
LRRADCKHHQTFTICEAREEVASDHIDVADRPFEPRTFVQGDSPPGHLHPSLGHPIN